MCEFCPAGGGPCEMCSEPSAVDETSPEALRAAGFRGAIDGSALARVLSRLGRECGPLEEWQLAAVIDGHAAGTRDRRG